MKTMVTDVRWLIAIPLVVFMAVTGVSLWFVDLSNRQSEFASLMAAELVALGLLLYLEREPSYDEVSGAWLIVGCAFLAIFLAIAVI